ncbi:MAG: 30S ribosomal protein S27ae [Candidatus Aenigmarchaeota archaeon]|nr:30S ribosomal protein S27ae [Candidatus Aenigmarchaeota archaeon]
MLKHKPVKQHEYFKVDGNLTRANKNCPRCSDTFLAQHKQTDGKIRFYCGKCHLSSWE